jgi:hypothetical protein
MRRLGVSRRHLFETVEMPVLAPLPDTDYQFAEWRVARVSLDYHVEIDGFFYSVPHGLIREQVDVRATIRTIELFHRGCVLLLISAAMAAAGTALIPITCPVRIGVTPSGLPIDSGAGGDRSGPTPRGSSSPSWPIGLIPNRDSGPVSACFGCSRMLIRARAELIAARAVAVSALTYKSIASIIANKLERSSRDTEDAIIEHPNLRGPGYFH